MTPFDPRGILIDSSLPRTDATRVADLLTEVRFLLDNYDLLHGLGKPRLPSPKVAGFWATWYDRNAETKRHDEDWEHWHEMEDDVIGLINDVLPDQYTCTLVPDDPGTVIIEDGSDDEG